MPFYPISSICIRQAQEPHTNLLEKPEKWALITDIALITLTAAVALLIALSNRGVFLGRMSGIGSLGMRSAYYFIGTSCAIAFVDLTNFLIQLSRHNKYLAELKQKDDQEELKNAEENNIPVQKTEIPDVIEFKGGPIFINSIREDPRYTFLPYSCVSGTLKPDRSILDSQLNTKDQPSKDVFCEGCDNTTVPLPLKTYGDLTRLGSLIVNGEKIYEHPDYLSFIEEPEKVDTYSKRVNFVFNRLEKAFTSTHLAIQSANLMEQRLGGFILPRIAMQKGICDINERGGMTHLILEIKIANVLSVQKQSFKLIRESIVRLKDINNLDSNSFFKAKTVVQGSLEALEKAKSEEMTIETVYTKEFPTLEKACEELYGFFDRETYLYPT